MLRTNTHYRLFSLLMAGLICSLSQLAEAQQQSGNTQGNSGTGSTNNTASQATSQGETTAAQDFSLDRPALTTDINTLTQEMQSGFVGTNDLNNEFLGVAGAGENANNQSNRQFNTRTNNRNVNQGTQNQPMYKTFGPNNVPYRAPHKIAFQVNRPPQRSVDVRIPRTVRILSSRRPQFANVQFLVSDGNTVTLRGSVANEDDRQLAMLYVKMEPGVDRVINELQVSSVDPTPLTPSAGESPTGQQ